MSSKKRQGKPPITHCPKCNKERDVVPERISVCEPCKVIVQQEREAQKLEKEKQRKKKLLECKPRDCLLCEKQFKDLNKRTVMCQDCKDIRSKDLIEVIYKNGAGVESRIFTSEKQQDAEAFLATFGNSHIVVDLHGVLGTVEEDVVLPKSDEDVISCCSYVGRYTTTRYDAYQDIFDRVESGQIVWGVLVFNRGNPRKESADAYHEVGSKAWYCKIVNAALFCDDSLDHIRSVESFCGNRSIHITKQRPLLKVLEKYSQKV